MFSQLSTFTADCLRHLIQMESVETIWVLCNSYCNKVLVLFITNCMRRHLHHKLWLVFTAHGDSKHSASERVTPTHTHTHTPRLRATSSSNGFGCSDLILLILPNTIGVPDPSLHNTGYFGSETRSFARLHLQERDKNSTCIHCTCPLLPCQL